MPRSASDDDSASLALVTRSTVWNGTSTRRLKIAALCAAGARVFLLTEEGTTFVLESGAEYKEIARNDLNEMTLASPAFAGDAIYIRTESKLYKIAN